MLPHHHFIVSTLTIGPVAIVYTGNVETVFLWVMVGGLVSMVMDLDVLILVYLRSGAEKRLQPYRNPLLIFRDFDRFMVVLQETGVRDTALKSHFMIGALIPPIFYILWPAVIIPVALAVISHLLTDLADFHNTSGDR